MSFETIISVDDLYANFFNPQWVIIDCRFSLAEPDKGELEYQQGHITGSYYAHLDRDLSSSVVPGSTGRHPLPEINALSQTIRRWGVNEDSQVVVYDHSNGGISARLWWLFRWLGHDKVAVLDGGWKGWKDRSFPEDQLLPAPKQGDFRPSVCYDLTVDADKVNEIRLRNDWKLIDARANERYLGLIEPIDPVAGHIEGAVNHPFDLNIDEQGLWNSAEVLKSEFEARGITTMPSQTIFYCGSGVTACHDILAYKHAGLGDALLYPGSWSEWITRT
ncbi:MAG: sulfurtransferase [Saprospiraceae bacterium]|nr:sulfurtransferase [Saprospiraceae bacterium]